MKADPPRTLRCVFYGDDFTGSTDALEVLAFSGLRCALFLKPPTLEQLNTMGGFDAVGVAGDSRDMSPSEMSENLPDVFRALHALKAGMIHYKVCSTFDSSETIGSIGRVLEIALDTVAARPVPIVAGIAALLPLRRVVCTFRNRWKNLSNRPTSDHAGTPGDADERERSDPVLRQTNRPADRELCLYAT